MKHSRFDRHKLFTSEDTSFVLDCIKHIDRYDYDNGGAEAANMLYGLFDGFLYDNIFGYAQDHLPLDMYCKLNVILVKVLKDVQHNGEQITMV